MADQVEVTSIGVGHGDATLIVWRSGVETPFCILVDGGPRSSGKRIKECLDRYDLSRLDVLVLSHVDADHIDGLLELVGDIEIGQYWGPCIEAFERYQWLFPASVAAGLEKARRLQERLGREGVNCIYPLEGFCDVSPDRRLTISVLSPPPRLLERLLLDDDGLDLFTRFPMPQGWLLTPAPEPPVEEAPEGEALRRLLRTSHFLRPSEVAPAPLAAPRSGTSVHGNRVGSS